MSYKADTGIPQFSILLDTHSATLSQYKATFPLQVPLTAQQGVNMMLRLTFAEIPHMFANVNAQNNTLAYQVGASTYSLTIPPANYNVYTLRTFLNDNLEGEITVSYISTNNTYLFSASTSFSILETSTCLELLGLHQQRYNSVDNAITSDGFINLSGVNALFVHSNIATQNRLQYGNLGTMLSYIPVNTLYGNMIIFNDTNAQYNMISDRYINSIDISFRDAHGTTLDISDMHFTLVLQVATVRHRALPAGESLADTLRMMADGIDNSANTAPAASS